MQVAEAVVEVPRVHVVKDPVTPVSESVTVPVGVMNVLASLSVTVTEQVEPTLMSTGLPQLTVVVVVLLLTVTLVLPLLVW